MLVIEDEVHLGEVVRRGLAAEGFDVELTHDGLDGLWRARERRYAAIVLDLLLPGMNGFEVCRTLRDEGIGTPILMLTAKRGEYDEAEALDTGADDFLSKPFSFVVLVARLRALARRGASRPPTLTVGDLVVDPAARTCHRDGTAVALTPRELALLAALLRRDGDVAPKHDLLRRGVGRRLRRRRQRRRGVRRLPAPQDRRAVRPPHPPDGPGRRVPGGGACVSHAGDLRCARSGCASRWSPSWPPPWR